MSEDTTESQYKEQEANKSEPVSLKRKPEQVSDSFESHEDNPAAKITHVAASSPIKDTLPLTSEQVMVKAMENSLSGVYLKLDTILNKINAIEDNITELRRLGEKRDEQLDELLVRVRLSEAKSTELEERLKVLETRDTDQGWSPSPHSDVKIKLLGDSNYSGKIKFGEVRGTLGKALPGDGDFCAKIENLPNPDALADCSDLFIAVGTNDLKITGADPTRLATDLYKQVKVYRTSLPNAHIFLAGVLPTTNPVINTRIKQFNKHLDDICNTRAMVTFVDTNVFRDVNGNLLDKFRISDDELHVNREGIKVIGSRMKFALRKRHNLPNGKFVPHGSRGRPRQDNSSEGASRGGGSSNRGGGSANRGQHRGGRGSSQGRGRGSG